MIPDSAVPSPVAVTLIRSDPPAATVPAMTASPGVFEDRPRLAGDQRLVDVGRALRRPCRRRARGRPAARGRHRPRRARPAPRSRFPSAVTRSAVSGSRSASAASAPRAWAIERISSQWPSSMIVIRVASSHQISTSNRPRVPAHERDERHEDRERDEGHHPGLPVAELSGGAANEHHPAIEEDDRAEDGREVLEPRDGRDLVAQPHRNIVAEQHDGNREQEAQPELVAEHRDGVARVLVMAACVRVVAGGGVTGGSVLGQVGGRCRRRGPVRHAGVRVGIVVAHTPPQYHRRGQVPASARRRSIDLLSGRGQDPVSEPAKGGNRGDAPGVCSAMAETDGQAAARLGAVFEAHHRRVLAYAMRRTDSIADAEDVVGETFAVAWRRVDRMPPAESALPWLLAIARRVASNRRRGGQRSRNLLDRLRQVPTRSPVPAPASPASEALMAIPAGDRELLTLLAWDGLSQAEAGAVLGISANAVAIRLHRARKRFASELDIIAKGIDGLRTPNQSKGMVPGRSAGDRST